MHLLLCPRIRVFRPLAEWVAKDPKFADFAGEFLKDAATGIDRLQVVTTEIKDSPAVSPRSCCGSSWKMPSPGTCGC